MREYFEMGFHAAALQMTFGVLTFVILAYLLHVAGGRLKNSMELLLGRFYRVIVIPGEFIRNMGIAIASMLTGTRMRRYVLSDDATGARRSITRSFLPAGTPSGFIRNLIILTSPIWFGSLVIGVIALVAGGGGMLPDVKRVFADGDPSLVTYVRAVITEAAAMFCFLLCVWHWTSPFCLFCMVCFVSIATEITIDMKSIWAIKTGLFGLFMLLIMFNAIPGISEIVSAIGIEIRPVVFTLHVILLFVVLFDCVFAALFMLLVRILCRRRSNGEETPC